MTETYTYCTEFSEVKDRLDYVAYNPEKIKFFNKLKRNGGKPLVECSPQLIDETIDPRQFPDKEFDYLGLENIEPQTGRATFQKLSGKQIYSKAKLFKNGDIVFGRLRPYLNKVHLVRAEEGIGSTELLVLRENNPEFRKYLLRYLLSDLTLEQTKWALTGSSLPRLTETDFKNLLIVAPNNWNEIINTVERIEIGIERIKQNIRTQFLEISDAFIKKNKLKVLDPKLRGYILFSESIENRLDFTWYNPNILSLLNQLDDLGAAQLGDLVEPEIEYGLNDYGREESNIPFINIENLDLDGRIHLGGMRFVEDCPKEKLLKKDDILISRSRRAGVAALITKKEENFTFGSYVLRLRVKKEGKITPLYLVHYLNSLVGQLQVQRLQTGSTGCNINPDQLRQIKVLIGRKEVSEITDNIKSKLNIIEAQENKITELIEKSKTEFQKLVLK